MPAPISKVGGRLDQRDGGVPCPARANAYGESAEGCAGDCDDVESERADAYFESEW